MCKRRTGKQSKRKAQHAKLLTQLTGSYVKLKVAVTRKQTSETRNHHTKTYNTTKEQICVSQTCKKKQHTAARGRNTQRRTTHLQVGVTVVCAGGVDAVLVGDDLPELGTDLVTALTSLNVNEFSHC